MKLETANKKGATSYKKAMNPKPRTVGVLTGEMKTYYVCTSQKN